MFRKLSVIKAFLANGKSAKLERPPHSTAVSSSSIDEYILGLGYALAKRFHVTILGVPHTQLALKNSQSHTRNGLLSVLLSRNRGEDQSCSNHHWRCIDIRPTHRQCRSAVAKLHRNICNRGG